MPNVGQILKTHNKKVLNQSQAHNNQDNPCNCRNKNTCPLQGKCQTESVIYQADVELEDGKILSYIGLLEHSFKKRWYNHCNSFKHQKHETSTELSKLIWKLKNEGTKYLHHKLENLDEVPVVQTRVKGLQFVYHREALDN